MHARHGNYVYYLDKTVYLVCAGGCDRLMNVRDSLLASVITHTARELKDAGGRLYSMLYSCMVRAHCLKIR